MPTTTYTQADFTNITEDSAVFQNAGPNLGTPPNATFSGAQAAGYSSVAGASSYNSPQASATLVYLFDLVHATPSIPIPANALITKITIQQQINNFDAITSITGIFNAVGDPTNTGKVDASGVGNILLKPTRIFSAPPPDVNAWITSDNLPDFSVTNTSAFGHSESASVNPTTAALIRVIFDLTLNPNGDFPLGYMDYTTFVTNFTNLFAAYTLVSSAGGNWAVIPTPTSQITGTQATGIDAICANLQVIVEWSNPVSWVLDTPTLTLPNNVVSISSPNSNPLSSIKVGDTVIEPNDPWVIVWTDVLIEIHLPPDETNDPLVQVTVIGTEFSGSVPLGTVTITQVDLSGIYQFDITAHSDTLYDHAGSTIEVAIPAPYFVTFFIDDKETDVMHYTGSRMRVSGQGIIHQVFQSLDYINTELFGDLILRTANNLSPFSLSNFIDQQASLRVYTTALDDYMNVSQVVVFFKQLYTGYPQ